MSMTKALGDAVGAIGKLNGSMLKMTPATLGLKVAVEGLKAAMNVTAKYAERNLEINERLLVLGTNQIDFFQENKEALLKNTASIDDQMRVATEMRAAGFEQFNKEQVNLAANMKMTGQNTKAALDLFAAIETNTIQTTAQQEMLAKTINDTALQYGRAAESIVDAVKSLDLDKFTELGIDTSPIQALVAQIAGPNQILAQQLGPLINKVLTLPERDPAAMVAGGLTPLIEAMSKGEMMTRESLREFIENAKATGESLVGGPGVLRTMIQGEVPLGDLLGDLTNVLDQFDRNERAPTDENMLKTLAARQADAARSNEVAAATITGFRQLKELSIVGNAFLESIAIEIGGPLMDGLGSVGKTISNWFGFAGDYYDRSGDLAEQNARASVEALDLQQQAALEAQRRRLDAIQEGEANRVTNRAIADSLRFSPGTALFDSVEGLATKLEDIKTVLGIANNTAALEAARRAMQAAGGG